MSFIYDYQINLIFRIIVAGLLGILIGLERKNRAKEAGIRTHCIVACASALMMIISKYGFFDLSFAGDFKFDPSRMAQGIVTGVGFLGAGMIYMQRGTLIGLTTASGVWAVSGIGMAIGSGMYVIGISATLIILFVQIVFHSRNKITSQNKTKTLTIYKVNEKNFQDYVVETLLKLNITVDDVSIKKYEEGYDYIFHIEKADSIKEEEIVNLFSYQTTID